MTFAIQVAISQVEEHFFSFSFCSSNIQVSPTNTMTLLISCVPKVTRKVNLSCNLRNSIYSQCSGWTILKYEYKIHTRTFCDPKFYLIFLACTVFILVMLLVFYFLFVYFDRKFENPTGLGQRFLSFIIF